MNQLVMFPTSGLLLFIKQDAAVGRRRVKAVIACTSPPQAAQEGGAGGLAEDKELARVNSPCVDALTQK